MPPRSGTVAKTGDNNNNSSSGSNMQGSSAFTVRERNNTELQKVQMVLSHSVNGCLQLLFSAFGKGGQEAIGWLASVVRQKNLRAVMTLLKFLLVYSFSLVVWYYYILPPWALCSNSASEGPFTLCNKRRCMCMLRWLGGSNVLDCP